MLKFKIQSKSKKALDKALNNYASGLVAPLAKANVRAARDLNKTARKNLDASGANDTGRLKSSIVVLNSRNGGLIIDTGTNVEYALDIEEGTKPHSLSDAEFLSLKEWVARKLKVATGETHHVAILVANKIDKKGTKAQPYLQPAANEVRPRHKKALIDALRKYNKKL